MKKQRKKIGKGRFAAGIAVAILLLGGGIGFGTGAFGHGSQQAIPASASASAFAVAATVKASPSPSAAPTPSLQTITVKEKTIYYGGKAVTAGELEQMLLSSYDGKSTATIVDDTAIKSTYDSVIAVLKKLDITYIEK